MWSLFCRRLLSCLLISTIAVVGVLSLGQGAIAAESERCQTIAGQEICVESLRRSAKYYWQYRAVLKIDGKRQPTEIFDCHSRTLKMTGDRPSASEKKRQFVCGLLSKR